MKYKIEELDVNKTDAAGLRAYYEFFMKLLAEARPEDPPRPFEQFEKQILNTASDNKFKRWIIRDGGKIVAYGLLILYLEGENTHIVDADLFTHPDFRKKGMAKELLKVMYDYCLVHRLSVMEFSSFSTTPSGKGFLQKIGAKLGKTEYVYQLKLDEVKSDLVDTWISRAKERAAEYQLEFWENETSKEKLTDYVTLYNDFTNSEPKGDLNYADEDFDVEYIKEEMEVNKNRSWKHWLLLARHSPSGVLAGFTEVVYTGFNKELVLQFGTGVLKKHRNRGLGRWLKAEMINEIRHRLPDVKRIRSHNATNNKAMTKINEELGFKVQYFEDYWHIETKLVGEFVRNI
jgi:GNAT superfamily N-acetyltransferase